MEAIGVPIVPEWNIIEGCVSTPDGGLLYISFQAVCYISKPQPNGKPLMKSFHYRQRIQVLDCDHDWLETKYFAILAEDNSVQICDFDEKKDKIGHRAHIKPVQGDDGMSSKETVKMCFLQNGKVLSIDSHFIVHYCIRSNTFTKSKRIISTKKEISIIKGSPYDENILAAGCVCGLVLVVDLKAERILYTLRGHNSIVTSLSWMQQISPLGNNNNSKRRHLLRCVPTTDDIFSCDYFENDIFGVPSAETCIENEDNSTAEFDKNKDCIQNENFNYLEECLHLKADILSKANSDLNNSSSKKEDPLKEVTLTDCKQSESKCLNNSSLSSDSPQSMDLTDKSTEIKYENDISFDNDDDHEDKDDNDDDHEDKDNEDSTSSFDDVNIFGVSESYILLASGANDSVIWLWNMKTGAGVQNLQLKSQRKSSNQENHGLLVNVCWINEKTLIANNRWGDVTIWGRKRSHSKTEFVLKRCDINHRSVSLLTSCYFQIIWTISTFKEIICHDIRQDRLLAKYSCSSANVNCIRESPRSMETVAFGFGDGRIGIVELGFLTHTDVQITSFENKIESSVLSLCWSPEGDYIAFGTVEGQIGFVRNQNPSAPTSMLKPFSTKPVHCIEWNGEYIFACDGKHIAIYSWENSSKAPVIFEYTSEATQIIVRGHYLFVGTQNGFLEMYKREDESSIDFEKITSTFVAPKFINSISVNYFKPEILAISSLSTKIVIFSKSKDDDLINERVLRTGDHSSGNTCVKWSSENENFLLSCSYGGTVRIWDLSSTKNELIFVKQYTSPIFYGIFSPLNENVIICAGKFVSIAMFEITKEQTSVYDKPIPKRTKSKIFTNCVQWATKAKISLNGNIAAGIIEKLNLNENEATKMVNDGTTTFQLKAKKDYLSPLQYLLALLQKSVSEEEFVSIKSNEVLSLKMFGTKEGILEILNKELQNYKSSETNPVALTLMPQLKGSLQDEIENLIKKKKLNSYYVSIAPTVSYRFWIVCCLAFAKQLCEEGRYFEAISYFLACHEIKICVQVLMEKKHFREAWIVAKIYRENDDPLLESILDNWIKHLDGAGNYEVAALLCVLTDRYQQGKIILNKRIQLTKEHEEALKLLSEKAE